LPASLTSHILPERLTQQKPTEQGCGRGNYTARTVTWSDNVDNSIVVTKAWFEYLTGYMRELLMVW